MTISYESCIGCLSEYHSPRLHFFSYIDASTIDPRSTSVSNDLSLRKRTDKRRPNRLLAILLTLFYLVQSIATITLVIRRSYLKDIIPFDPWLPIDGTDPVRIITAFEYQVMLLAIYGILVAIIFIVLQITRLEWVHVDDGRHWTYSADPKWNHIRRSIVGICGILILDNAIGRVPSIKYFEEFSDKFSRAGYRVICTFVEEPVWYLLFIALVLVATSLRWQRIAARLRKIFGCMTKVRLNLY